MQDAVAQSPTLSTQVVIVGAGPVGKTAALLLAVRGIRSVVIEKGDGLSDEPKAISVDDEALRIYQRAGIVDEVLRIIVPGLGTRYFDSDGAPIFLGGTSQLARFGYPYKNPFSQPELEAVLHRALLADPLITYLTRHEVVFASQTPDLVSVAARRSDGAESEIAGEYLIAADGGRSTIRAFAGIGMDGRSHPDTWLVIDALDDPHDERYGLHYGDPARPHVIVPGLGGRCRYEFPVSPEECAAGAEPSLELMRRLVAPYRRLKADQVERAVVYRFHALNAQRYREGRFFLAGDAAHMMPPFAGQGLNSGMRDVSNLTWKLWQVLDGRMPASILDSYDQERRPQAGSVVRFSERLGRVVMTRNERIARARDRIVREHLQTPEGLRFFAHMGYRPSLTLAAGLRLDGAAPAGDAIGQPRVFDLTAGVIGLLDDALGDGWAVVGVEASAHDWAEVAGLAELASARRVHADLAGANPRLPETHRRIADLDGALAAALEQHLGCFLLVRPDRVVAAVWAPEDSAAVTAAVSAWFVSHEDQHDHGELALAERTQ